ncbi:BQ5605_C002g01137 [Microbotryum silenes-dioicae]|uniref:Guanosine-3',5'-bis(diphosphate) 3'-pyrophosphohydrolase MESH1 n=1 Tax=Microbotryum silenes-dioicae TaxID=796604 RepID=A0A2X0MSQ5_9BASI|nr:BQ5605_C002g01137 [Microbotryum silenes-dioicae]
MSSIAIRNSLSSLYLVVIQPKLSFHKAFPFLSSTGTPTPYARSPSGFPSPISKRSKSAMTTRQSPTPVTSLSQSSDTLLLLETLAFSARAHEKQKRKNKQGTPYIQHPLDVARRIAAPPSSLAPSPDVKILQAAILHDTIEDTDVTPEDLERHFGREVMEIVMECTDDGTLSKAERKQTQIDRAPSRSFRAKQVKLADKWSNLTDLTIDVPVGWTAQRVQEYFIWGKKVVDGCKGANPGMEAELDELFKWGTFKHEGKEYECHPTYRG